MCYARVQNRASLVRVVNETPKINQETVSIPGRWSKWPGALFSAPILWPLWPKNLKTAKERPFWRFPLMIPRCHLQGANSKCTGALKYLLRGWKAHVLFESAPMRLLLSCTESPACYPCGETHGLVGTTHGGLPFSSLPPQKKVWKQVVWMVLRTKSTSSQLCTRKAALVIDPIILFTKCLSPGASLVYSCPPTIDSKAPSHNSAKFYRRWFSNSSWEQLHNCNEVE